MSKLDPTLAVQVQANPQTTFQVIVRVQGDMDARQGELEANGFTITRRLRLIQGYSADATGETLLRTQDEEWIISIELDAQVRTMTND